MIFLLGLRFSDPPEMEEAEGISATRFLEKSGGCKKEMILEPEVYRIQYVIGLWVATGGLPTAYTRVQVL